MIASVVEKKVKLLAEFRVMKQILRDDGLRALIQKYGWKLVAVIVVYYLVRDLTLYVLVPFLIVRHFS